MPKRHPSIVIPGSFLAHLEAQGGVMSISYNPDVQPDPYIVGYHFGRESEDSDMVGGAAYGVSSTAADAFAGMLQDLAL